MFLDVYYDGNPVTPNDPLIVYSTFILAITCFCISIARFVKFLKEDKKNEKSRNKLFKQTIIFLILGLCFICVCWVILQKTYYW